MFSLKYELLYGSCRFLCNIAINTRFFLFLNDYSVNIRVFSPIVAEAEPMHQSGAKSFNMPLSL